MHAPTHRRLLLSLLALALGSVGGPASHADVAASSPTNAAGAGLPRTLPVARARIGAPAAALQSARPAVVAATGAAVGPPARAPSRRGRGVVPCGSAPPPPGAWTFEVGERITYDVDVMGVRAGTLTLEVQRPTGGGLAFVARAKTNTFFENVRKLTGRATSYAREDSLRPLRYREDAREDGVEKWADVLFPQGGKEVDIRYAIGGRERRVRYPVATAAHDVLSIVYYLRTLDLKLGQTLCLDVYGNRKVWRLEGSVAAEEWVSTPAGEFKTFRLSGTATRLDLPSYSKEVHLWLSHDPARIPVAAVGVIDLGAIRAQVSRLGDDPRSKPDYLGGPW